MFINYARACSFKIWCKESRLDMKIQLQILCFPVALKEEKIHTGRIGLADG